MLQRQNLFIALWHSHNISAGMEWAHEINRHLDTAHVILLLVSSDFLASDDLYNRMVKKAIQRHERGETRVIPIILRPVHWQGTPLGKLQALPEGGKPVTDGSWHSLDEALFDVARSIRRVVEELASKPSPREGTVPPFAMVPGKTIALPTRYEANFVLEQTLVDHWGPISCVAFADEETLISDSWGHTIKVWNLRTGRVEQSINEHSGPVYSIALSGGLLASGGDDGVISIHDIQNQRLSKVIGGHAGPVSSLTFNPDGTKLASGSDDTTIKLWSIRTGKPTLTIRSHAEPVSSVTFSPDGKYIASGSYDRTIMVHEPAFGFRHYKLMYSRDNEMVGHTEPVSSVAYHPKIELVLASGSHDTTIKIWSGGRVLHTLRGHRGPVASIAFSPDGTMLVSGSHDKTVKVWDVTTGMLLMTLNGHTEAVLCVAFHPKGNLIVSGGLDQTIKLWRKPQRFTY